jgi:hypothetical protein
VEVSGRRVWRRGGNLAGAIAAARQRGAFPEPWLIEGAALAATEEAWRAGASFAPPRGPAPPEVPAGSLGMLNAGFGLGLARRVLGTLPRRASAGDVAQAVARFHHECRAGATPGYEAAALQGLGFVARIWHRRRLAAILEAARGVDADVAAFAWHAVGRALYFLPRYFPPLPGTHRRTLRRATGEAPAGDARAQCLAGLLLAATLTNMRHPRVLEGLLVDALHTGAPESALSEGVRGGCGVREDATPGSGLLAGLLTHRPRHLADQAWERLVRAPCRLAMAELPAMQRQGRLTELLVCRSEALRLVTTSR